MILVVYWQTVRLEWDRPESAELAGCPISRYTVRLRADGARRSRTWKVDGDRRSVTLYGLDSAASYHVRVLAVVCHGKGKPSPWLGVRTVRSVDNAADIHSTQPIDDHQGTTKHTRNKYRKLRPLSSQRDASAIYRAGVSLL